MSRDLDHASRTAELEAENRELRERLERADRLIERAGRHELVSRLGTSGIHQLRNLMTGLHGNARLLLEEKPIGDPDRDALLSITRSSSAVIEHLSRFGRVMIGRGEEASPLELREEIAKADPMIRTLFGEWIALDLEMLESARVRMSPDDFRRLLLLVSLFALDRMPGGGMVRLALERDRTVDDDGTVRRWAVVTIADTGDPMTSGAVVDAIDPLRHDPPDGVGLGIALSLAAQIADDAGGRLRVTSSDEGTSFRIDLPLEASYTGNGSESGEAGEGATPTTILVVDDDDAVRMVAGKILHRFGYRVLDADSGAAALEILEGCASPPELLLTDIVMPGMNGRELSEAVGERWPEIPTLFMSAYTEDEVILHGIRVSEVNFLPKPFTLEALGDAVRAAIGAAQEV